MVSKGVSRVLEQLPSLMQKRRNQKPTAIELHWIFAQRRCGFFLPCQRVSFLFFALFLSSSFFYAVEELSCRAQKHPKGARSGIKTLGGGLGAFCKATVRFLNSHTAPLARCAVACPLVLLVFFCQRKEHSIHLDPI